LPLPLLWVHSSLCLLLMQQKDDKKKKEEAAKPVKRNFSKEFQKAYAPAVDAHWRRKRTWLLPRQRSRRLKRQS
jgi:hypothetical protein